MVLSLWKARNGKELEGGRTIPADAKTIVITENPIDAISYQPLHPDFEGAMSIVAESRRKREERGHRR